MAEGRKIVASLHFQFILFLLGEKWLRIISDFFFCLTGEYQVYQEYQEFTKNTKNTHEITSLLVFGPSLHFQFILFLLGEKSLRIISDYTKNLPRIPRTHMKSLHYWFLVSCVIKGVKSSLRFISNLFLSYWAKNRFAPFLTFFGLIGEYQVYQEYQEFTKNTRNTHEIASLFPIFSILTLCRLYLFSSMKIQVLLHFHIFST